MEDGSKPHLRTTTLARIMLAVGIFGWLLIALSLAFWLTLDFGLQSVGGSLIEFLTLLFTGTFFAGLCQAWFGIFAGLSGRLLPPTAQSGARRGVIMGGLGVLSLIAMVSGVLVAGARGAGMAAMTTAVLITVLTLIAGLLVLQRRWIASFAARTEEART